MFLWLLLSYENREASRKRQTSDSSWEFLKIENEQLKTIIMDKKLRETTPPFMCRK